MDLRRSTERIDSRRFHGVFSVYSIAGREDWGGEKEEAA